MRLCKYRTGGEPGVGLLEDDRVYPLRLDAPGGPRTLSDVLHAADPEGLARSLVDATRAVPRGGVKLLPPIDHQEVWAAGVTYTRSREARERESEGAARFYDLVYRADRPELFFKATARRAVGDGDPVRIRRDAKWSVPEPEFTLVVSPDLRVVGYTVGNDMSSRDIEGENPLYLPQAKLYDGSCAIGPAVKLGADLLPLGEVAIRMDIARGGKAVFAGGTTLAAMARTFADLVAWLSRDNSFPDGVLLLTGTGIVPPDDFTLASGDEIAIDVTGVGTLRNTVA